MKIWLTEVEQIKAAAGFEPDIGAGRAARYAAATTAAPARQLEALTAADAAAVVRCGTGRGRERSSRARRGPIVAGEPPW
ncbi:hypothetical protein L3Q67_32515 [Saccharothrix sp. AJ9571]|nr:hypothetical protein L3Q67_32515 [Saccharothrix sp. AJ9571]